MVMRSVELVLVNDCAGDTRSNFKLQTRPLVRECDQVKNRDFLTVITV
jgi:hypothetical protein